MKSFAFDGWDGGRLTVNREFAPLLTRHALTTFDAIANFAGGRVAKNVLRERTTTRLDLADSNGTSHTLYLKRHLRPGAWELVKPLFRLARPIVGARNEWEAILRFHKSGIATMVPVALGESGSRSFLVTEGIEDCEKLTAWMQAHRHSLHNGQLAALRDIVAGVADVARTMHAAGLHHQDFYLTHLMVPAAWAGRSDPRSRFGAGPFSTAAGPPLDREGSRAAQLFGRRRLGQRPPAISHPLPGPPTDARRPRHS